MARVNVEQSAFNDPRFKRLGRALGVPYGHAKFAGMGLMAHLWNICQERYSYMLAKEDIDDVAEMEGAWECVVAADLGEETADGIRIRGTEGRIEWLGEKRKRIAKARRKKSKIPVDNTVDNVVDNPDDTVVHNIDRKEQEQEQEQEIDSNPNPDGGNGGKGQRKKRVPNEQNFPFSAEVEQIARESVPRASPRRVYEKFLSVCGANGYGYIRFNSAFRNFCDRVPDYNPDLLRNSGSFDEYGNG